MERTLLSKTDGMEAKIVERIAAAGIRLRRDKVALRLLASVQAGVGPGVPADQCIAFAVTAPIRLPAKTSAALQECLRRLRSEGLSTVLHGNEVRARLVRHTAGGVPRVMGFVHNPDVDGEVLLTIVATGLRE